MAKVLGIGGIFFRSEQDPKLTGDWYQQHLGIPIQWPTGSAFPWHNAEGKLHHTIWSPFKADTGYFRNADQDHMVNYIVDDLDQLLAQLRAAGVTVAPETDNSEYGYFGWAQDPNGQWMELWQPPATPPNIETPAV